MATIETARKRRLTTFLFVACALVAAIALTPIAANAVHNEGLFELEGNIADDAGVPGHDWASFHGPLPPGGIAPVSSAFISDGFNGLNDTIYFGGGSQNNNDIPSWRWSCGSVSTKSDIEHAFASAYIKDEELFLYFGADRYDPTGGTTNVGFWFLQNGGALEGGTGCPDANPATNTFSGQHVNGDLFIFAEFTGGGGDSAVSMYEWLNGGLHLLATKSSGLFCSADDSICALTNDTTIASTWPYTDNQGGSADGQILEGGFVEGGINLTDVYEGLGKELPCINRFLAQTGSSHPDTGVLEDFAGGAFNLCSKLIVDKVTPSGDQTKFAFDVSGPNAYDDSFQLADADTPHDSGQVKAGTYEVTETPGDPAVWNAPSVSCHDQGSNEVAYEDGAVAIAHGATVTCTFTNTKKPRLTVVKKIVGGDGVTDTFDVKVDGATKIDDASSTAPAGTSFGPFAVSAGAHTVSETLGDGSAVSPSDWNVSFSGDCDSSGQVTVQNDQSKTCTITNSKLPKLTVVKEIEGGDGSTFDISVGGTMVIDDAEDGDSDQSTYAPGSYSVTETFGDGAAIGSDWTVVFSGDCDANGGVSLAYGDDKTCTITNKRKPKLTVVKVIEGGKGAAFDLKVNGSTVLPDVTGSGGQVTNTYPVDTAYSVTETMGDGTAVDSAVWETSMSGDCAGTLAAGDEKTCTITNKRKPKLTVVKVIEGGNGASFDLAVNGSTVLPDVTGSGGQVTNTYPVGTAYTVTETLGNGDAVDPAVWETSMSADCSGSLAAGDEKTCTVTNKRKPKLTVVKVIQGGKGAAFDLKVNGSTVLEDVSGSGGQVTNTYSVDTAYSVSETMGDGTAVDSAVWESSMSGDCAGTLAAGDEKTCTITNKRKPKLTVVKVIEGGNGASFDLAVNGSTVLEDVSGSGDQTTNTYPVDTAYTVTETLGNGDAVDPAVWETSMSADCSGTLAAGDDKTCTITNKRKPKLTVVKVIEGGKGAAFDLKVNGSTVLEDVSGSGDQVTNTYPVDTAYTVTETMGNGDPVDPAAWETSMSGACAGTLAAGDEKTCTITNKRKPRLTVVKVIEGGKGETFDLAVNGSTVLEDVTGSGDQVTNTYPVDTAYTVTETMGNGDEVDPALWDTSTSGDCAGTLAAGDEKTCTITNKRKPRLTVVKRIIGGDGSTFDISVGDTKVLDDAGDAAAHTGSYAPGTYAVTETLGNGGAIPSGWSSAFTGDCDANGSVSLAYGDEKTCTVTNSKLPILTVVKEVVDGIKSPGDFQISVEGEDPSPSSFPGSAGGTVVILEPGAYDVSETEDPHYTASYSADCKDGTIDYGESKTCTITNTRKPSGIEIVKDASPETVSEPGGQVTFTFTIRNTSPADTVTITELDDSIYGDLFAKGDCGDLDGAKLAPDDQAPGGLDETTCSFTETVSGDAGDQHHNIATVDGLDEDERPVTDSDFADVGIKDVLPSITVTKTADPVTLPEPGGPVEFTVVIQNDSVSTDPVTITSLVDDPDGQGPALPIDLDGKGSCDVPQTIQPGDSYTCKFTRTISGNAGEEKTDVVTASGHDDDENPVSDDDDATVTLTDVASSLALEKTASPTSVQSPGADVTFTVVVRNTSPVDAVTIDTLVDDVYGNLNGKGNCGALIGKVLQPDDHAAGGPDEATCSFTGSVTGPGGSTHTDVVTVTGHDDDGAELTAHDDATVTITPLIDLYVTKNDSPGPVQLNGQLTYTIVVGNNGPDTATQVTLADPLPAGTAFVSVATTQGSCTGGPVVNCSLGTIPKGSTVTITVVVTALRTGTLTNTATVVGKEPESNTANNQATATTRVPAVVRKPQQAVCDSFTATPKSLTVGRRSTIVVRVTAGGKPAKGRRVVVKGAGINKSARTNSRGVARIIVKPRRAGIVTITVPQRIACGTRRIGVVGAFQPPLTG